MRFSFARPAAAAAIAAALLAGLPGSAAAEPASPGASVQAPLPPSQCAARFGAPCYGAPQLQAAYGVDALHRQGVAGQGQTLAVIMPYRHPTVAQDLNTFSAAFGLPGADLEVVELGDVPDADPQDPAQAGYLQEAGMDLQMMHAMAPRAKLILVSTATPGLDQRGTAGWREVSDALVWLSQHREVTAVSMSYGTYEQSFAEQGGYRLIGPLREGLRAAARTGTTVLAASGNTGPTGPNRSGGLYGERAVAWPASDPLVTGVGATDLHLDDDGDRTAPDELWTRDAARGGSSGGGLSRVFPGSASAQITAVGGGSSRVWAYSGVNALPGQEPGWTRVAGTSVASPVMAGIVALAAQQAGHGLGTINGDLARIRPGTHGTQDLASGCNTLPMTEVRGWCAHRGRDVVSGVGTLSDAAAFTRALAR